MEHLDRILDGEDVAAALAVDPVDQRRDRGGLAGAGRPGDEHEALLLLGEAVHRRGQAELVEGGDLRRDAAHDHGERPALAVDGDAEAAEAGDAEAGVGLAGGGEVVLAGGVEDGRGERLHDAGGGHLERGGLELAVDADVGDGARLEVQVGPPDLVEVRQELFQLGHTAYIGQPAGLPVARGPHAHGVGELRPDQGRGRDRISAGSPALGGSGTIRSPARAPTQAAAEPARASRS